MNAVTPTVQGLLVGLVLLVLYAVVADAGLRRLGARPSAIGAVAAGVASMVALGCALALAARAASGVGLGDLPLTAVSAALVLGPLAVVAWRVGTGRLRPSVGGLRAAAGAAALILVAAVALATTGVLSVWRTDSSFRADAVKELVWSGSAVATGDDPALFEENDKYASYLVTRAAVTDLGGGDPLEPSTAWLLLLVAGAVCALWRLAEVLGLGRTGAAVTVVAAYAFGGDAYRLATTGDPRPVATMLLLAGLGLIFAGIRSEGRPARGLLVWGGLLAGSAGLAHFQYLVIVSSVLGAALVVAAAAAWPGRRRLLRPVAVALAVACACAAVPLAAGFVAGRGLVSDTSLASAAAERVEGDAVRGQELLVSGKSVFPPERVELGGYPMLYSSPNLYALAPDRLLVDTWGERSSPLLIVLGVVAAVALAGVLGAPLWILLAGGFVVPLLVLLNPVAFPFFDRVLSVQRSEYVGFEFAFLALAALVVLAVRRPKLGVPLLVVGLVASAPLVTGTRDWYRALDLALAGDAAPGTAAFRSVEAVTRHGDDVVVPPTLVLESDGLEQRRVRRVDGLLESRTPAPGLAERAGSTGRQVLVVDPRCARPDSALARDLRSGALRRLPADGGGQGRFVVPVDTGRPCAEQLDLPREAPN